MAAKMELPTMDERSQQRSQQRQGRARAPRDEFSDFPGQACCQLLFFERDGPRHASSDGQGQTLHRGDNPV